MLRTRFKKEIIAEFLPPRKRQAKKRGVGDKVIIICDGMPSVPSKRALIEFWARKGYWVFHPRYRGSWESGGRFLEKSPHKDVLDVIDGLPRGFKSLYDGKICRIKPAKIFLIGSSFGGPAVILASRDKRVSRVIAFSPVIDWLAQEKTIEPIDWIGKFTRQAFGEGYRFTQTDWGKLKQGNSTTQWPKRPKLTEVNYSSSTPKTTKS